ncbi:23S rRNA (guanosine(2251)-2'-O)-methyltransferase RlmB [Candidatus Dojkabacteria bacterium]|nr:23S rRNA (guanosine(2251)-2'-O)-methyltransferase RlmB [Candidatus Dojkabacteria bacterium]
MASPKKKHVQVESKNALLELLHTNTHFDKIYVANNAYRDPKTKEIIRLATSARIPIEKITRKQMNMRSKSSSCESVIGLKPAENIFPLKDILAKTERGVPIFILILNDIKYSQNIGALLRTAYASGVTAVVVSKKKDRFLTEDVTRISMGASERVPIVQMNLFDAIKQLQDFGVCVLGVDMDGEDYFTADLKGDIALVLGAEDEGISKRIIEKCDRLVRIPMEEGIGSLNVSASGAVLMYEKKRQDLLK